MHLTRNHKHNQLRLIQLTVSLPLTIELILKLALDDAITGIKRETKKLSNKVDVLVEVINEMQVSNKSFHEEMLIGLAGLSKAVEKQSEANQAILDKLNAVLFEREK